MLGDTPIFEKKNIVVTGGAGFLGSHLCERLLREAKVICIDDLTNSTIQNIDHLLQYPDFEFIKADVTQPIDLDSYEELDKFKVRFQGIQEIYHLACPTSPKEFDTQKIQTLLANSRAMTNTLDLAVQHRAKYVFTSSSVIYGTPRDEAGVFAEADVGFVDHLSNRSCYEEGKRFAESCIATYRQVYGVDAKIARVFTTYGPRMKLHDKLFIPDFILDALEGKNIAIPTDADFTQSLCYVTDMVDGLVRLMHTGPEAWLVNLGHDQVIKMVAVAQKIIDMTESTSQIVFEAPDTTIHRRPIPDLRNAKEALGWIPIVGLEEGLQKMIDYTIANKEIMGLGYSAGGYDSPLYRH